METVPAFSPVDWSTSLDRFWGQSPPTWHRRSTRGIRRKSSWPNEESHGHALANGVGAASRLGAFLPVDGGSPTIPDIDSEEEGTSTIAAAIFDDVGTEIVGLHQAGRGAALPKRGDISGSGHGADVGHRGRIVARGQGSGLRIVET